MKERKTGFNRMMPVLLLTLIWAGCSNEKDPTRYPLTFEKSSYSVSVNNSKYITIRSGNKDYTLIPGDENLIQASYSPSNTSGDIQIVGLKRGETTLTIKDNVTGETEVLKIVVTRRYLNLSIMHTQASADIPDQNKKKEIQEDILENAALKKDDIITLIANEEVGDQNKFYLFDSSRSVEEGKVLHEGKYSFEEKDKIYSLTLTFDGKETSLQYILTGYNLAPTMIKYLGVVLDTESESNMRDEHAPTRLSLLQYLTEAYQTNYPGLTIASFVAESTLSNNYPEPAVELVK